MTDEVLRLLLEKKVAFAKQMTDEVLSLLLEEKVAREA